MSAKGRTPYIYRSAMRKWVSYEIKDVISFKKKLVHYAKNVERFCILNSNEWRESKHEMIAGMDVMEEISPFRDDGRNPSFSGCENSFDALKKFYEEQNDWLFGFLTYDLKNEIEPSASPRLTPIPSPYREGNKCPVLSAGRRSPSDLADKERGVEFPLMHFFQPKFVFCLTPTLSEEEGKTKMGKVEIHFLPEVSSEKEVENLFYEISNIQYPISNIQYPLELENRISREEYLQTIYKIKNHIHRGDIYEMNYCMEFFSEDAEINPAEVFLKLNETSQSPFSAFYRMNNKYLLCASPERFLKKEGRKIISQPIKGTARRGKNSTEDIELKELLSQNEKEKSENVMIVDLVRNDLSRTCENVNVDELFGVYTFKQWHQMISTVCGEMKDKIHFTEVIKNSFPMGSMTGAPKVRAMELIEQYEKTKRGLYSGAVGYITPPTPLSLERGVGGEADFDFNVVIRSILYNASSKYLSFQAGSAITANSIPENEYEECLLKAKGMFSALGAENPKSEVKM